MTKETCVGMGVAPELMDCSTCGWVHRQVIPTEEDAVSLYLSGDYHKKVKPGYAAGVYRDADWHRAWHRHWLTWCLRHVDGEGRKLLDYGCGPGMFLRNALNMDWDAWGVDPSPVIIRKARDWLGSHRLRAQSSVLGIEDGMDVVVLMEVLEHMVDPAGFLVDLKRGDLLRPGGLVLIQVPNEFNPLQKIASARLGRRYWLAEEHFHYWTSDTLAGMLRQSGFQILDWSTTFPMEVFLLAGLDYTADPDLGRKCHEWRMELEGAAWATMQQVYRKLRELDIGRDLVVLARKPGGENPAADVVAGYGDQAWGVDRTVRRQVERLGEETMELAMAVGANDPADVRRQVGDVGLLLADIAQLLGGGGLDALMEWKLAQKKESRT